MKIGIDIGGSHIAIGVIERNGKILEKLEKRLTSIEKKDIKKSIEEYILEQVKSLKNKYEIEEIGIGTPRMGGRWSASSKWEFRNQRL